MLKLKKSILSGRLTILFLYDLKILKDIIVKSKFTGLLFTIISSVFLADEWVKYYLHK